MRLNLNLNTSTKSYYDSFEGKFAGFVNCVSYRQRVTPFFNTVPECEQWRIDNNVAKNSYIHPIINWQETINKRNEYNTESYIEIGQ